MAGKESHQIRNGIIATVVGGALLSLWPSFRGWFVDFFGWLWTVLEASWGFMFSTHAVYGWVLIGLVLLAVPTTIFALLKLISRKEADPAEAYTADSLFGADWYWRYAGGSISNLWCLCPECESELVYSEFRPNPLKINHVGMQTKTDFICERCQVSRVSLEGDKDHAIGTVTREIRRKIRTGEWKASKEATS